MKLNIIIVKSSNPDVYLMVYFVERKLSQLNKNLGQETQISETSSSNFFIAISIVIPTFGKRRKGGGIYKIFFLRKR